MNTERRRDTTIYGIGFVLALVFTALPFGLVWKHLIGGGSALLVLALLALTQIAVHFRCFLHIDLRRSHRDDLQLILFSALIIVLMAAGSLWVLHNQMKRMM